MNRSHPSAFRKFCAGVVAVALIVQPLGVAAATTVLAEKPLQGLNPVLPNVLFTLDDSGSMTWDYLPDWTAWKSDPQGLFSYCRDKRQCGGTAGIINVGTNVGSLPLPFSPGGFKPYREIDPPLRSSDFNKTYYNPVAGLPAGYRPGKRNDGTDLPCEGSNTGCTGPWTAVYMNGYAGYPGTNTSGATINLAPTSTAGCVSPATPALCVPLSAPSDLGPWPGVPDTLWCRTTGFALTGADYQTADGDGSVCRRNGREYPETTIGAITTPAIAAGYNYPNGVGTSCTVSVDCFTNSVTAYGFPFYYTISNVWFCSESAGGWGTGACGKRRDAVTYKYVRYSSSATTGPAFDPTSFTRVDITPPLVAGVLVNGKAAANPSGRSYAQEMANFARWYAFHRTRMLAMQTAAGIAFSALREENARVGFATLNENSTHFLNVKAFDPANKATWFTKLYTVAPRTGGTPLPDAAWNAGEYFSNSGSSGFPGASDPLDPVTGQCQRNYHLLSTDGYWNFRLGAFPPPSGASISPTDQDNTVPSLAHLPGQTGFTPVAPFPRPYYEGATASNNTLADIAMKYWINDIRPTLDNKVQDTIAPWQHLTLYGLTIGAEGNVIYPGGLDAIVAGTQDWPVPTGAGGPESIDDLWHAALNSRGKFFNAKDPQELAASVVQALNEFTGQAGTGTAVGIAGAQISATKNFGYRTSYEVGWWGDVRKYALDPATGALPVDNVGNPLNAPLWSAATQLDAQTATTGWKTNRRIVTINDSAAVPFLWDNLSSAQQASLISGWKNVTPTPSGASVVNYLRGDQSNEGVGVTNFRVRSHILGDIVYSGAVPVGAPNLPYDDAGNPGYSAFVTSKQSRTPTVYVGGNDGMLHAFNDSNTADAGKETWAFIPKAMFTRGDPNDAANTSPAKFQLGALSYGFVGDPLFTSHFYVNFTARVWDIDFKNTNTKNPPKTKEDSDWRTMLVGGLGAGGRAIYALDVTNPVGPPPPAVSTDTEDNITGKVLWEFTHENLGYVYDAPTLVKTYRYGWVVLVASGYNNPGGEGILYVLNPTDGTLLKSLSTKVGTDADPSGLSTIRAFTASRKDPYVLQAYGGDLKGNVWRFDLSDPDEKNWTVDPIAKLADASGKAQPITTGVRIEIDQNNNVDRYLFVGTGKLLGPDDIKDTSVTNTLYVIRDGTRTTAELAPAKQTPARGPYTRTDLNAVTGGGVSGFSGPATGRGWFQDAPDATQKIGTDVHADVQTVVYAFSKPSTDPCAPPLSSTLFARDLNTGNSVLQSAGGAVVPSITDIGAIAGVALIQGQAGTGSAASGDVRVQVTTMKGQVFSFGVKLAGAAAAKHRVSWRLLNRE